MKEDQDLDCSTKQSLSIWYCEHCGAVHFRAGELLLTFSPAEFLDFAARIGEIYGQAYFEVFKQRDDRNFFEFDLVS